MAEKMESGEVASSPCSVRIELGGLIIAVENASDLDSAARVALGLLAKAEPLAKRNPVGFTSAGFATTEIRSAPDLSWRGVWWDPDY